MELAVSPLAIVPLGLAGSDSATSAGRVSFALNVTAPRFAFDRETAAELSVQRAARFRFDAGNDGED